jgi:hypothetical protein
MRCTVKGRVASCSLAIFAALKIAMLCRRSNVLTYVHQRSRRKERRLALKAGHGGISMAIPKGDL